MSLFAASDSPAATLTARAGRREWIGLAVLTLPAMLLAMDLTMLYLAVPALSVDLAPSGSQLLWITDIYGFLIAGSLITMGTLGDRIGRRRLLLIGAAGFALASILAAFSTSAEMLIATRALLGVTGATLMPSTLSLIRNMFHDSSERTTAIGIWATSFSVGGVIGPLMGGLLLQYFWWGSVFLLGVPVMVLLLVIGPMLLPEYRDPTAGRFDLVSAALSLVAVLAIIYGIKRLAAGDAMLWPALSVCGGLVVGTLFVRRQNGLTDPLVDLRLFDKPAFSVSVVVNMSMLFAWAGSFLLVAQYLQLALGLGALEAGLWTLPGMVTSMIGCLSAPFLVRRWPVARVVCCGVIVSMIGFAMMLALRTSPGAMTAAIAMSVIFTGIAVTMTLTTDLIVSSAPPERAGAASAISETAAELGLALGVAVLGSIGAGVYRLNVASSLPPSIPDEMRWTAMDTLAGALTVADRLGTSAPAVRDAALAAFVDGLLVASALSAALCLVVATLIVVVLGRASPAPAQQS
jgi:DHA2 family multidrug resistance protein-like MFS transporter